MTRRIHFGLFLLGTGSHVAGWRVPGAMDSFQDIGMVRSIAMEAERGLFDLIFMGDNLNADPGAHPSYTARLEPLTLLAAIAGATRHIGLGATMSTTYSDPFTVARAFASLDHISGGRAAWNAVTTANPAAAANFGTIHPDHSKRYEIAEEFLTVVRGLWDCWDDDAIVADRESGVYIDPAKVRALSHDGAHFKVKGPINISRSPQGQPIILQAGGSGPGQELAAKSADVVFSVTQDLDEARTFYASVKGRLPKYGRSTDSMVILPGVMPIVGRTEREAHDKLAELQGFISETNGLSILSDRFGVDMSQFDLDGPIPDIGPSDNYHAFAQVMLDKARRENMRLRDLYNLVASARGHWVLCGTPDYVADTLETWFTTGAADGFNIMPSHFLGGLTDFVDMVVPLLQERGLYRTEYEGTTLRDRMGFAGPPRVKQR
ncbi:FMN-dependent oxidoreductase (nitrilotriacetate monooxygenase family) [Neorhizobium galegae]|uniref:LLM class flavin-dependent oxidoreductase n=1 Tax=Neorhizobium galegae TaxID=399 RepID=UPI0027813027|nr:LLM class flavin-dependent oxidoreductase [Neorhizobium galegae]MDQ0133886.1 FMN-dependent oxidoreductase (nitrilotriacetate monooxygenase family) [Neorhizobium galegae]